MRTSISIRGLQSYGYHGLFEEERTLGQRFVFNLRCELSPQVSHLNDTLDSSVGYHVLAQEVVAISGERKFRTVEALAETIARRLLEKHAAIDSVQAEVAKFSPPMDHALESATVEVLLRRDELGGDRRPVRRPQRHVGAQSGQR